MASAIPITESYCIGCGRPYTIDKFYSTKRKDNLNYGFFNRFFIAVFSINGNQFHWI